MDHQEAYRQFLAATGLPDEDINLARASLLIAASEYPDLDVDSQLAALDSLAAAASARIGDDWDPFYGVNKLSEYLFDEVGLSGNNDDYYDPRNSYLNEVLTRRIGIPITLSLVCVLVGDRAGIPLQGVGMPGHFLVSHRNEAGLVIDPFHRGIMVSEEECAERLQASSRGRCRMGRQLFGPRDQPRVSGQNAAKSQGHLPYNAATTHGSFQSLTFSSLWLPKLRGKGVTGA